ncbi:MAG: Mut7-C RNAse domain-containing protein [Byssovorax sp.]
MHRSTDPPPRRFHFLLRLTERGKEPHAEKQKQRDDIAASLCAAAPEVHLSFDVGRIYVEADRDLSIELARLHGISSFSPCVPCDLDDLDAEVLRIAGERLAGGGSFSVKVKRSGAHDFSSNEKAAALGQTILEGVAGTRVDLGASKEPRSPDEVHLDLSIEIRERRCFVCTAVIPGIDAHGSTEEEVEQEPAGEPRFLVDAMLGTLASRLRAFGYDTAWRRDTADSLILREARNEHRIVLTQDRELAEIGGRSAYFVRARAVDDQFAEVMDHFGLVPTASRLFTRCSVCNDVLSPVEKASVEARVPPRALARYDAFWLCRACDKVYWKGSHYDEIVAIFEAFVRSRTPRSSAAT